MNRSEFGDGNTGASNEWCCIDANEREQHYAIVQNHLIILLYLPTGKTKCFPVWNHQLFHRTCLLQPSAIFHLKKVTEPFQYSATFSTVSVPRTWRRRQEPDDSVSKGNIIRILPNGNSCFSVHSRTF